VPTGSGCGATVGTRDDNVSSGGMLPIARDIKFASKERGHKPNDDKAVGAVVFGMCQVVALARGGTATGTRHSADGAFVLAPSGDDKAIAATARQLKAMQDATRVSRRRNWPSKHAKWLLWPGMGRPPAQTPGGRQTGWPRQMPQKR
jgi:hypothetical protein